MADVLNLKLLNSVIICLNGKNNERKLIYLYQKLLFGAALLFCNYLLYRVTKFQLS